MQGAVVEEEELLVGRADAEANIRRGVHVEFYVAHAVGELEVGDTDGVFWVGDDEDLIQREALSVLSWVNWKVGGHTRAGTCRRATKNT